MGATSDELRGSAIVRRYLAEPFVPRQWLADRIEAHLDSPECRYVLITAGPGMGKSALAAWLSSRQEVSPRYFIRLDSLAPYASGDATELLLAIGRQLALLRPEAFDDTPVSIDVEQSVKRINDTGRVTGVRIKRLVADPFRRTAVQVTQRAGRVRGEQIGVEVDEMVASARLRDPEVLQHLALFDPAERMLADDDRSQIIVMIDALDELRHRSANSGWSIADWLANCPALPANVRIVVTSRPDDDLLRIFQLRQQPWLREVEIDPGAREVAADLMAYADRVSGESGLAELLARHGFALADSVRAAAVKAHGNFLFLVAWTRALSAAAQQERWADVGSITDLASMPSTLDGLYELFVLFLRKRPGWSTLHRPVLGVLAVARGPLSQRQLARFTGVPVEQAIADMRQFLTIGERGAAFFHVSLAEFLTDQESRCYIDPIVEHRGIAESLIAQHGADWASCADEYALANVVTHLIAADLRAPLADLLADQSFVHRKTEVLGTDNAFADFVEAYEVIGDQAVEALAKVVATATADGAALDADALHAGLAYRRDAGEFYERVLVLGAEDERADVRSEFYDALLSLYRRQGKLAEADRLLTEATQLRSKTLYERGYLDYLHGRVDEALDAIGRSGVLAREAGNDVTGWISELVHDLIAFQAGRLAAAPYREKLREAELFFAASDGPHVARWQMSVHGHMFNLACVTGDVTTADTAWQVLAEHPWMQRMKPELRLTWEARLALLHQDWPRAVERYERLLGSDALTAEIPGKEEVARNLLDYGRALHGAGRIDDARRAWTLVGQCPDGTAAWPWQPQAERLLQ